MPQRYVCYCLMAVGAFFTAFLAGLLPVPGPPAAVAPVVVAGAGLPSDAVISGTTSPAGSSSL